jgi:ubiquinone biosynthesis UbiH/UbiF/VisC/COQ6 family hydroxylase
VRTYALNARAVALLERLRVWPELQAHATPVWDMVVRGDEGGQLAFSAWQQQVRELTWIVDAGALEQLLAQALRYAPGVQGVAPVQSLEDAPAPLLAICEGKASLTRETLGVRFDRQAYGHMGVAARLQATQPHQGVARQWFRSPDVLALLPFHDPVPGSSYGLVWSQPTERAQALMALSKEDFQQALMDALQSTDPECARLVGKLSLASESAAWPLALARADRWCGPGWVLLGDAAHQVHPLAGQGLNLGLADVHALVTELTQARRQSPWRSPGDERVLQRYARRRLWPTRAMSGVTDGLLHLFADDRKPVRDLRNAGMALVQRAGPIKRWLVGQALDR